MPTDPVVLGGIALALCYAAYVAEVFRAGIESIHPSQTSAALVARADAGQSTRHVVLPQAVRRVMPPLLNDFIALQKDVALVSILGPLEAFRQAQIDGQLDVQLHAPARSGRAVPGGDHPDGATRRPAAARATACCAAPERRYDAPPVLELQG